MTMHLHHTSAGFSVEIQNRCKNMLPDFFIEANGSVYSQVMENGSDFGGSEVSKLGSGLGLAVGWKYVTLNNWVGEIYLGGGRNFIKKRL